jgi:hypothetical protein
MTKLIGCEYCKKMMGCKFYRQSRHAADLNLLADACAHFVLASEETQIEREERKRNLRKGEVL